MTYADSCSDLGPSLGNIAWDKTGFVFLFLKNDLLIIAHEILILIVSAMQVCAYRACVTLQQNLGPLTRRHRKLTNLRRS